LHMAQLMPLPRTVSCFSKIQVGFNFLVLAHLGSPRQRAIKWVLLLCTGVNINLYSTLQVGPDWEQVINKISRGRYLPLLLVYGDHDNVHPMQSHEPLTRINVKGSEPSSTNRGQQPESRVNRRGMMKIR